MEKITEDYVSYEVAKLLKEKGFEGYSTITIYDEDAANAYIKELKEKHLPYSSDDPKLKEFYYTTPTLQMACKWLRKVHKINITIGYTYKADANLTDDYVSYCFETENAKTLISYTQNEWYDTYEQACEAAIKYCLENLI